MSSIKLTADSGGGTFELKAPSSSGNTRVLTLPEADATLSTVNGITEADTWFLTTSFDGDVDPISNNLSRLTLHGVNYLGTGMSVSSGVWTFPSTGFWRITVKFRSTRASGTQSQWQRIFIKSTVNNSAYNPIAIADSNYFDNYGVSGRNVSGSASIIFDCTNTSTHKIKFATGVQDNSGNSNQFIGSSSEAITTFEFIKLAET